MLPVNAFKMSFSDQSVSFINRWAVTMSLPSFNCQEVSASYRNMQGWLPGEKLTYDSVSVRFAIDEQLLVHKTLFDWIKDNTDSAKHRYSDIVLHVLDSNKRIVSNLTLVRCFPTSIGTVEFNVQNTEVEYAYMDVVFRFDSLIYPAA